MARVYPGADGELFVHHGLRNRRRYLVKHVNYIPQRAAHIGLVFDLYDIDVRQFLQTSKFTQSGMRHVLNSVLEGLLFIHCKGCIHCDLKPANIFMRGAIYNRGCFEKDGLTTLQHIKDWGAVTPCPHNLTEFECQIPNSFEARGGSP